MDMSEQKTLLEEALATAATSFEIDAPPTEAVPCDEIVDRRREQWQAGDGAEVDPAQLDQRLAEVRAAWEDLGFEVRLSTLDDGSEPALFAKKGEVSVSATSGPPQGDIVGVSIGGSTACGDIG